MTIPHHITHDPIPSVIRIEPASVALDCSDLRVLLQSGEVTRVADLLAAIVEVQRAILGEMMAARWAGADRSSSIPGANQTWDAADRRTAAALAKGGQP